MSVVCRLRRVFLRPPAAQTAYLTSPNFFASFFFHLFRFFDAFFALLLSVLHSDLGSSFFKVLCVLQAPRRTLASFVLRTSSYLHLADPSGLRSKLCWESLFVHTTLIRCCFSSMSHPTLLTSPSTVDGHSRCSNMARCYYALHQKAYYSPPQDYCAKNVTKTSSTLRTPSLSSLRTD